MSTARGKGTAAETAVAGLLRETWWPYAERRALHGGKDRGDTTGHPGLVFEVKACARMKLPAWLRETETERVNANADYGILVAKPAGVGVVNIDKWTTVMTVDAATRLMEAAQFPAVLQSQHDGHSLNPRAWLLAVEARRHLTGAVFSAVEVRPRGVEAIGAHHHYMYLRQRLELLHLAGYGQAPTEQPLADAIATVTRG